MTWNLFFRVFEVHEEDIKQKVQPTKGREREKDSAKSIVGWVEVALDQAGAVKHGPYKVGLVESRFPG